MDFLPEKLKTLNGLPLIGSIIWISLIVIILFILLFSYSLERYKNNKGKKNSFSDTIKNKPKGF